MSNFKDMPLDTTLQKGDTWRGDAAAILAAIENGELDK